MESGKQKIVLRRLRFIVPILLGAAAGYLYYSFIGCVTGRCLITGNPWSSTILGAFFGAAFIPKRNKAVTNEGKSEDIK